LWRSPSKLANLLFTYELDRRLRLAGAPTIALAAHPGVVSTGLFRTRSKLNQALISPRLRIINFWFAQSVQMGARPALRAAVDPSARGGQFYGPHRRFDTGYPAQVESSARSRDVADQARLWEVSEQLTGVCYDIKAPPSYPEELCPHLARVAATTTVTFELPWSRPPSSSSARAAVAISPWPSQPASRCRRQRPYAHFTNRDDLLAAVAVRACEVFYREMLQEISLVPEAEARLAGLTRCYVRFAGFNRPLFEVLFTAGIDKRAHPEVEAAERPLSDTLLDCVRAVSGGEQSSSDDLATAVEATAHGHAMLLIDGDFGAGDEAVELAGERAAAATLALIEGRQLLSRRPRSGGSGS
jgi:AcrR family transcriptional regulator